MNIPESVNLIDTVVSEKTTYFIEKQLRRPRWMTPGYFVLEEKDEHFEKLTDNGILM
jgi:hypothetical protein